ncbi:hypothetical protein MD484_g5738, partial [Candolleomyces efflorescens]
MPPAGAAVKKLFREITELRKNPPEGIRVQTSEEDMFDVTGIIEGPEGTPYAGGYFRVRFNFTEEFPNAPPKCWFATKLFHPNVGPTGEICVNTLKKDWKPTYGIGHILVTVKCLLIYPNPESALDEEAGKLFMEDYESYCSRAKLITSVHATPRKKPEEFETPSKPDGEQKETSEKPPSTSKPAAEPVASTSKLPTPVPSAAPSPPPSSSSSTSLSKLGLPPTSSRKSASPAPPTMSLKSGSSEKEGSGMKQERHSSPAPLSTADANVEGKSKLGILGPGLGLGLAPSGGATSSAAAANGSKSMKRSATNSVASGAEKRKKALKRL